MSGALDVRDSWSKSLEDLVAETGQKQLEGRGSLAFAPRQVRNPRAYDKTPVVLVVASAATRHLHKPLFEALELMEKASGAFKVAVFAEAGSEDVIKSFDWAVEQCFSEAAWWSMSSQNWLIMAGDRLEWAQNMYGASYILAARSVAEAATELAALGTRFGIEKLVISAAQSHIGQVSQGETGSDHAWVRGWMDGLPLGESVHRVEVNPLEFVPLRVTKRAGAATLISGEDTRRELLDLAHGQGWSVISINAGPDPTRSEFVLALRRAFSSALASHSVVFQSWSQPVECWDPSLGAAAIVSASGEAWELVADEGLRVEATTVAGLVRIAKRFIEASSIVDSLD